MNEIVYFGTLNGTYWIDREDGSRTELDEATWLQFIHAAGTPPPVPGAVCRLHLIETVTLAKFNGEITPDSVPVEIITLE